MVDFKPFQQVRIDFIGRLRLACILPWIYGLYAHFLHMTKDCFVIDQIMLFFVKIPANAAVSIHRVSGIDFVNHLLYVQILCRMWSRLIIEPASIKFQKAGLYRNRKSRSVHIHKQAAFRYAKLRNQIFFSTTHSEW